MLLLGRGIIEYCKSVLCKMLLLGRGIIEYCKSVLCKMFLLDMRNTLWKDAFARHGYYRS